MITIPVTCVLAVAILAADPAPVAAGAEAPRGSAGESATASLSWPGWRGPMRDGVDLGARWPDRLSGGALERLWRIDAEPSYSGPVGAAGMVFLTGTRGKSQERVLALDGKTGREIWQAEWPGAMTVPFFAASNGSWIRSTPATDGEKLFVAGMRDVLVCLDIRSGKEDWRLDFVEKFKVPLPAFGFVSSPLLDGAHIYVQAGAAALKLLKRDGSVVWRSLEDDGGMYGSAFSSPCFADIGGRRQLLVQTRTKLAGLDPESGAVLWSQAIPATQGMNILPPTASGDRLFTTAYGGSTVAYDVSHGADRWEIRRAWEDPAQGYMSSPMIVGGNIYLHMRNQRMACFDLASGRKRWTSSEQFGKYMSFARQGDRLLALDERGILFLFRANPERLEVLDSLKISEDSTWGHIGIIDGIILVRELKGCAAYRWMEPRPVGTDPARRRI